ncbi:MAG: RDD family protein, partial [Gemmatimonadota bacterium]
MDASAIPTAPADRRITIETPEHVAVGYELADLGSRFVALLIDGLILLVLLLALGGAVPFLALWFLDLSSPFLGLGAGALTLIVSLLGWGYFVLFEGLRDGQTPGKRAMRIRAVHDGGYPLTMRGSAVRNLLRLIDIQPGISCIVGGAAMMLHPRTKRLGDIAAATVVVRERAGEWLPQAETAEDAALDELAPPRLSDTEYDALDAFMARRTALRRDARGRIAARLVARLADRMSDAHAASRPDGSGDAMGSRRPAEEVGRADSSDAAARPAEAVLARLHADESRRRAGTAGASGPAARRMGWLLRERRAAWTEYAALLERARRRGLDRVSEAEVSRFAALYRGLAADLARARTYGATPALLHRLERWVAAGHNLLYRPVRRSWRRLATWLRHGFPALARLRWRPIALAAAIFLGPAIVTYAAVRADPPLARELLPSGILERAQQSAAREAEGRGYLEVPEVFMPILSGDVIANNVKVTFAAFAGGLLAGLGTIAILVLNGAFLGAAVAAFANEGTAIQLWTFVLPHGVI